MTTDRFRRLLADLPAVDTDAAASVRERAGQVLRPSGALQRLDDVAVHVAGWQATPTPRVVAPAVVVFAGDHGVAAAGVSAYPTDVTGAMLAAVRSGRATVNAVAQAVGATVTVHDVGVGRPTGDIRYEAAMTPARFDEIVDVAVAAVDAVADAGADLLAFGELGIGNTTVAAALAAAVVGGPTDRWVGRGTGVDDGGLERKRRAVEVAVGRIADDDPIEIMREIGGAELVAIAVATLRARSRRIPVVVDGYIATAALLPLHAADPGCLDHCLSGHRSAEPGHRLALDHLGWRPLLDLDMRLGEGSGAVAAVPIVRAACAGVVEVATFDEWLGG